MHRTSLFLVWLVALVTACHGSADQRAPAPAAGTPRLPVLTKATQQDLAADLDDAAHRGTWSELKRKWQGQLVTWTVTRHRMLCRTADACNVAAFPVQRPATHGWMPRLTFAPGQFAALEAACGNRDQCDVTIEGTLSSLAASAELPTHLELTGVRLGGQAPSAQITSRN
jgi:hypothetical protein